MTDDGQITPSFAFISGTNSTVLPATTPSVRIFFSHPCSIALLIFAYYISFERGGIMSESQWLGLEHILCSLLVCVPETEEAFCSTDLWKVNSCSMLQCTAVGSYDRSIVLGCLIFIYLFYSALICGGVQFI